jgi:hypothetical protein
LIRLNSLLAHILTLFWHTFHSPLTDGSAAAQEDLEQKKLAQLKNMHIPGGGHGQVGWGGATDRKLHPMLAPLPDVTSKGVVAGGGGQGQGQTPRLPPIEAGWGRGGRGVV